MSRVHDFDFINRPTYLFFRWVRDGGGHDLTTLVSAALNAAEHEEFFSVDGDVSSAARDALAKMLDAIVDDLRDGARCGKADGSYGERGDPPGSEPEWLTRTLLATALDEICCDVAAEAMLREAGKWAPDKDIPEAE